MPCAWTWSRRSNGASSSPPASSGSPCTRWLRRTRCPRTSRCWRPTRSPDPPLPEVVAAATAVLTGPTAIRTRGTQAARGPRRPLRRARPSVSRSATARATPAHGDRRGAARARRRARLRLAVVQRLPVPGGRLGRHRDPRAAQRGPGARPRRDARPDHRRHAAGHRLQPEQPHLDRAAARGHRGVHPAGAAPRLHAARRGVLRVQHPRRPGRVGRPAGQATRTSSCCGRSARSTALPGLRVGYALCADSASSPPWTRSASPSSATAPRRRLPSRPSSTRMLIEARVERNVVARVEMEAGLQRARASSRRPRRRTSAGSTCRRTDRPRPRSSRPWPIAAILVRGGTGAGQGRGAARHLRHAAGERPLPCRARRGPARLNRRPVEPGGPSRAAADVP